MTKVFAVGGMTCDGCAAAVRRAIKACAADAAVEVDLGSGWVSVDGIDDEDAIRDAVEAAGFEFRGAAG